jgi:hypothetical protein
VAGRGLEEARSVDADKKATLAVAFSLLPKKKSHPEVALARRWWSRRESNPRPQIFHRQIYMLILTIWF